MKRIYKYNILLALAITATSCISDDEKILHDTSNNEEAVIRIVSGRVGDSTRAFNDDPSFPGQCNADRLVIYKYSNQNWAGTSVVNKPDPKNMDFEEIFETDVIHFTDPTDKPYYQSDKWAIQLDRLSYKATKTSQFAFPSLAFTNGDKESFVVSYSGTLDQMSLKLVGDNTPELYFGRLKAYVNSYELESNLDLSNINVKSGYLPSDDNEVTGIYGNYETYKQIKNVSLTGKLYRIVSQINVTISNVNPDLVEKMTMELSNIPTEIGLYAGHRTKLGENGTDHGYNYPIVAANSSQQKEGPVVVCKTSEFRKGIANLSTFLLPETVTGRSLNIHVYYKEPVYEYHSDGSEIEYQDKSYEVRPPKSYYIPVNYADAFFSTEPLCVYNVTDNLFYSYANVRVNLTGDFDSFFPDRVYVDMDLEICPRYDGNHVYEDLIDYSTK